MKRKYIYFGLTIIIFIVVYKLVGYFYKNDAINNVIYNKGNYEGNYLVSIDEANKDNFYNHLVDINAICQKLIFCKFKKKTDFEYNVSIPYQFLNHDLLAKGLFVILPLNQKNKVEYQFDGSISTFPVKENQIYPLKVMAVLDISENIEDKTLQVEWNIESPVFEKVTNRLGKEIVIFSIKQLQSSLFDEISSKISKG